VRGSALSTELALYLSRTNDYAGLAKTPRLSYSGYFHSLDVSILIHLLSTFFHVCFHLWAALSHPDETSGRIFITSTRAQGLAQRTRERLLAIEATKIAHIPSPNVTPPFDLVDVAYPQLK
jgi:hypothetical protein